MDSPRSNEATFTSTASYMGSNQGEERDGEGRGTTPLDTVRGSPSKIGGNPHKSIRLTFIGGRRFEPAHVTVLRHAPMVASEETSLPGGRDEWLTLRDHTRLAVRLWIPDVPTSRPCRSCSSTFPIASGTPLAHSNDHTGRRLAQYGIAFVASTFALGRFGRRSHGEYTRRSTKTPSK